MAARAMRTPVRTTIRTIHEAATAPTDELETHGDHEDRGLGHGVHDSPAQPLNKARSTSPYKLVDPHLHCTALIVMIHVPL